MKRLISNPKSMAAFWYRYVLQATRIYYFPEGSSTTSLTFDLLIRLIFTVYYVPIIFLVMAGTFSSLITLVFHVVVPLIQQEDYASSAHSLHAKWLEGVKLAGATGNANLPQQQQQQTLLSPQEGDEFYQHVARSLYLTNIWSSVDTSSILSITTAVVFYSYYLCRQLLPVVTVGVGIATVGHKVMNCAGEALVDCCTSYHGVDYALTLTRLQFVLETTQRTAIFIFTLAVATGLFIATFFTNAMVLWSERDPHVLVATWCIISVQLMYACLTVVITHSTYKNVTNAKKSEKTVGVSSSNRNEENSAPTTTARKEGEEAPVGRATETATPQPSPVRMSQLILENDEGVGTDEAEGREEDEDEEEEAPGNGPSRTAKLFATISENFTRKLIQEQSASYEDGRIRNPWHPIHYLVSNYFIGRWWKTYVRQLRSNSMIMLLGFFCWWVYAFGVINAISLAVESLIYLNLPHLFGFTVVAVSERLTRSLRSLKWLARHWTEHVGHVFALASIYGVLHLIALSYYRYSWSICCVLSFTFVHLVCRSIDLVRAYDVDPVHGKAKWIYIVDERLPHRLSLRHDFSYMRRKDLSGPASASPSTTTATPSTPTHDLSFSSATSSVPSPNHGRDSTTADNEEKRRKKGGGKANANSKGKKQDREDETKNRKETPMCSNFSGSEDRFPGISPAPMDKSFDSPLRATETLTLQQRRRMLMAYRQREAEEERERPSLVSIDLSVHESMLLEDAWERGKTKPAMVSIEQAVDLRKNLMFLDGDVRRILRVPRQQTAQDKSYFNILWKMLPRIMLLQSAPVSSGRRYSNTRVVLKIAFGTLIMLFIALVACVVLQTTIPALQPLPVKVTVTYPTNAQQQQQQPQKVAELFIDHMIVSLRVRAKAAAAATKEQPAEEKRRERAQHSSGVCHRTLLAGTARGSGGRGRRTTRREGISVLEASFLALLPYLATRQDINASLEFVNTHMGTDWQIVGRSGRSSFSHTRYTPGTTTTTKISSSSSPSVNRVGQNARGWMGLLEFYSRARDMTVVSVRGTDLTSSIDMLQDVALYFEAVFYHVMSSTVPGSALLPSNFVADLIRLSSVMDNLWPAHEFLHLTSGGANVPLKDRRSTIFSAVFDALSGGSSNAPSTQDSTPSMMANALADAHERYYHSQVLQRLNVITAEAEQQQQQGLTRRVLVTGHSLGGAVSHIAVAKFIDVLMPDAPFSPEHIQSLAFSAPGIALLHKKFDFPMSVAHSNSVTVVTSHDFVPLIGGQVGEIYHLQCSAAFDVGTTDCGTQRAMRDSATQRHQYNFDEEEAAACPPTELSDSAATTKEQQQKQAREQRSSGLAEEGASVISNLSMPLRLWRWMADQFTTASVATDEAGNQYRKPRRTSKKGDKCHALEFIIATIWNHCAQLQERYTNISTIHIS